MNKATTLKLVAPKQPHPLAGKPVLESAPLRRGHKRSALSCFEDSTWDLSPAVFRENARVCHVTVHFDGITEASVDRTLREFLYARLNFDIPGHRNRLPPAIIRQLFNRTRRFLEFVAARNGTCDLGQVDQATLDAYRSHLTADPQRQSIQVAHLLEVVVDLHHFHQHMPSRGIRLLPWKGALGAPCCRRLPSQRREQDTATARGRDCGLAQVVAQVHHRVLGRHSCRPRRT
jgi:hypothetical protein